MTIHPFSASNMALLLISVGLLGYYFFFWRLLHRNADSDAQSHFMKPVRRFALVYSVYFIALCGLAATGFFTKSTVPPRFLLIFLPFVFMAGLLSKAKLTGALAFLRSIPPVVLIAVQSMRVLIELLFLQFANEKLIPQELSFHGRNYDLLIGVLAVPVSWLFSRNHPWAGKAGLLFNVLGLISLINIFSIVIPALPSPFQRYDTLYLPTYFPGILIVFLASSALYLHILSLRQLLAKKQQAMATAGSPAVAA